MLFFFDVNGLLLFSRKTEKSAEKSPVILEKNGCMLYNRIMTIHPFPPIYDHSSKTLILGSFPSVVSREVSFYYGNPRNRFWSVLSEVFGEPFPKTVKEKESLVLSRGLALWDVIKSCDITGSADGSIKNAEVNDIASFVNGSKIDRIFINGKTAAKLYDRFCSKIISVKSVVLPSTSPANAAFSLEDLVEKWKIIAL